MLYSRVKVQRLKFKVYGAYSNLWIATHGFQEFCKHNPWIARIPTLRRMCRRVCVCVFYDGKFWVDARTVTVKMRAHCNVAR